MEITGDPVAVRLPEAAMDRSLPAFKLALRVVVPVKFKSKKLEVPVKVPVRVPVPVKVTVPALAVKVPALLQEPVDRA